MTEQCGSASADSPTAWKIPPTVKDTGIATSAAGMVRKKPKNEERGKLRQGKTSFLQGLRPRYPPAYGIFLGVFAPFGEIDSPSADAKEYPLPVYGL